MKDLIEDLRYTVAYCNRGCGFCKDLIKRTADVLEAIHKDEHEIQQILGKALNYPWFKDDLNNFPDSTEADEVCVGEHVAVTLAMEAAELIKTYFDMVGDSNLEIAQLQKDHYLFKESVKAWIKSSNKLPSNGQHVLVYYPARGDGDTWYEEYIATTYYWTDEEGFWYPGTNGYAQPTYWMPLPENPQ